MPDILEIDSVIKSFGHNQILTDIYLKCETGDRIGLFGRNGTGKSTLLKIIFGSLEADNKFLTINNISYETPYKVQGLISYLPQNNFLPGNLKVKKVIELFLHKSKFIHLLKEDNLINQLLNKTINELSSGEMRYLEINLVLAIKSKFTLLDEPFTGLAPIMKERIMKLILFFSKHKGIIVTDHDYRNILETSNNYFLLIDGALKKLKSKEDLINYGYLHGD